MGKIVKIEGETILIGTDDGRLLELKKTIWILNLLFGIEVEVYANETRTIVLKKELPNAIVPVQSISITEHDALR